VDELTTDQKGALAELAIATEATRLGFGVMKPLTDGHPYDLILEVGGRLLRVQCKWARRLDGAVNVAAIRSRRIAGGGQRRSTYSAAEVDIVAAYCAEHDRCFAVPIGLFGRSGHLLLRLYPARNGQRAGLHFADDFELGAIAQLEERRRGTPEAGGSSPPSSTCTGAPEASVAVQTPAVIGAHEFRNRFGWYMERAAAGEELLVTHRGRPRIRIAPAQPPLALAV
jgi:prevent-host-death family protein